jgi:hypothetical protein
MSQPLDLADDEAPIPSPRPSPNPLRSLFFSGQDNATPVPDPATDPETGAPLPSLQLDDQPGGSASVDDWSDDAQSDLEDTTSTGSRAGEQLPGFKLGKAAMRATAAKGVIIGSGMLHRMATRAETIQREAGLYLADEEDAKAIGHPLADIVSRRGGVAGKALSADANDALSAALGLAGFMSKQIALQMQIAQHERAQAGGGAVDV